MEFNARSPVRCFVPDFFSGILSFLREIAESVLGCTEAHVCKLIVFDIHESVHQFQIYKILNRVYRSTLNRSTPYP